MNWIVLIVLGTIWGASYLFIKIGGSQIPPVTFVAARVTIAAIAVAAVLAARRERFPRWGRTRWLPLVGMGIFNGVVPYTLITWGETQISSGLAGILVGTMPIFTVLIAHWLTHDEKLNGNKLVGIAIGFGGVVILFLPDLQNGITMSLFGALATVIAAASYAFASVFAHKYVKGVSNLAAEFGQLASASVMLVPVSLVLDRPWQLTPSWPAVASLVTLALLGTAFAYLLYYWLIEHAGPTSTSLVTYISPVSAILLGALVLHETFDWTAFAGLIGIIAGVGLVTRNPTRAAAVPASAEAE
jgi:drug/metabolite transporter (DMT)-like permease